MGEEENGILIDLCVRKFSFWNIVFTLVCSDTVVMIVNIKRVNFSVFLHCHIAAVFGIGINTDFQCNVPRLAFVK